MSSTPEQRVDYVFGYGSLVALTQPLALAGRSYPALPGRLSGFRRSWGVAMNNWEASGAEKHFVDPETGLKPHIGVAYLDIKELPDSTVNGLAVPADARRLAEFDLREVNYTRIDVSSAFEPRIPQRVFAYQGTEAAGRRCLADAADAPVQVSRRYVGLVRRAFVALGPGELEEYERTTLPLRFPERDLELRYPAPPAGDA